MLKAVFLTMRRVCLLGFAFTLVLLHLGMPAAFAYSLDQALAYVEQNAKNIMADESVPGIAVAVVKDDQVVLLKGFGVKDLGGSDAVDADTLFGIGSTSKAFTSAALAMMVEEGRLAWTDKVKDHYSGFAMPQAWMTDQFQVRDIMAQRSGLRAYALTSKSVFQFPPAQVVESLPLCTTEGGFRADYAYQNVMFLLAGLLVEKYTGSGLAKAFEQRIFQPLGMSRSVCNRVEARRMGNVAGSHLLWYGQVTRVPDDADPGRWMDQIVGAGGVISSARDMSQWLRFQINGGTVGQASLLKSETMDFLHKPQVTVFFSPANQVYYAQGWLFQTSIMPSPFIWHDGNTRHSSSFVGFVPSENLGIAVLCNLGGAAAPIKLGVNFFRSYFGQQTSVRAIEGAGMARGLPKSKDGFAPMGFKTAARPLASYAGVYNHPAYGDLTVEAQGSGLVMKIGPEDISLPLYSMGGDLFMLEIPYFAENAGGVEFHFDQSGSAAKAMVELFTYDGGAEAVKVR